MTNPLIDKFYELHPDKKEKPKTQKTEIYDEVGTISEEKMDILSKYLKRTKDYASANIPPLLIEESRTNYISTTNSPTSIKTYDIDSTKDMFLETAEKVKRGEAKVTSMTIERDIYTGIRVTFEVLDT